MPRTDNFLYRLDNFSSSSYLLLWIKRQTVGYFLPYYYISYYYPMVYLDSIINVYKIGAKIIYELISRHKLHPVPSQNFTHMCYNQQHIGVNSESKPTFTTTWNKFFSCLAVFVSQFSYFVDGMWWCTTNQI